MNQLIFKFPFKTKYYEQDYYVSSNNFSAYRLIESWPNQYQTYFGERGIRLSGGQRQRIGIARALYKQANVLILDEATSALDSKTEESVIKSIKAFSDDITLLMIAHRVTTLRDCDYIVELDDGSVRIGSYDDLCK